MNNLFAARSQMAVSLGFHIIFASIGIAMPFLMAFAHWRYLKTKQQVYLDLAKAWSKGVAIFFAVGAVSGTVLSFELGLLWPRFMEIAGPIIGMPFSWEGAAFFLEAIALGIYLYGWKRVSPWTHWASGVVVGISGVLSGLFVICANGWMNSPAGFVWANGQATQIDPWAAMFNKAALWQGVHMTIAAFAATAFGVAGIHAYGLIDRRNSQLHRKAYRIAINVAAVAALMQIVAGDRIAKDVAVRQPLKLAAAEDLEKTSQPADLIIGTRTFGVRIPKLLSFLAHGNFHAEVKGLDIAPPELRPNVAVTRWAFEIMVGLGMLLAFVGALSFFFRWRDFFLYAVMVCAPLGFIAMEAGWTVTEVGRQPWIIYKVMKTSDAITPMPHLAFSAYLITALYLALSFVVVWLMVRQFRDVE